MELIHGQVALAAGVDADRQSLIEHRVPAFGRVCGLAECLPFRDESFDLIVCSWVLEHLTKPDRAFREVARVLRSTDPLRQHSGGHFVLLTPNAWHPLTWINRILRRVGGLRRRLIVQLYGRVETDTFPAIYRANTRGRIFQLAEEADLTAVGFSLVADPTYLAFNDVLFRLTVAAERYVPAQMKIHLVGDFVKVGGRTPVASVT